MDKNGSRKRMMVYCLNALANESGILRFDFSFTKHIKQGPIRRKTIGPLHPNLLSIHLPPSPGMSLAPFISLCMRLWPKPTQRRATRSPLLVISPATHLHLSLYPPTLLLLHLIPFSSKFSPSPFSFRDNKKMAFYRHGS